MGITAEKVAQQWKVSREAQDVFAAESHRRALAGDRERRVQGRDHAVRRSSRACPTSPRAKFAIDRRDASVDEGPRRDTSPEALAKLKPAFAAKGTVTAGNSSQMSDGAGAVVLMSEAALKRYNLQPLGRFVGYAVAGVPPDIMGIGPMKAIPQGAASRRPQAATTSTGSS